MMVTELSKYSGKRVRVHLEDGDVLEGFVNCYLPAEENEGKEAIGLNVTSASESSLLQPGNVLELAESELASIEVVA